MMRSLRAATVQMVSSTDPETNIVTMKRFVREAAEQGADWVLLPEYWPLMGKTIRTNWHLPSLWTMDELAKPATPVFRRP